MVGLLLGLAGPFGSYPAYPTATRYAFWLGLTAAGAVAALAADALLPRSRLRPGAVRIGALALVSAVPMTFVVAWTMSLVQPGRVFTPQQLPALFACVAAVQLLIVYATTLPLPAADGAEAPRPAPALPGPEAQAGPAAFPSALLSRLPPGIGSDILALETEDHYLRVHASGGSALILMRMADAAEPPGPAPNLPEPGAEAIPAAFPPALLSKLPPGIGSDIIALETEDHYLRVHAAGGNALILMRMADAVALLDPRLGAQVHRRWWVAQDAVEGVRTEGQKLSLRLIDKTLVPVGRTFAAAARARFARAREIAPPGQASAN